jgi:hypothetical protein
MKTKITVAWSLTLDVEVDSTKMNDEAYLDKVRNEAVERAGSQINWKDGMVTDCEDFPQISE